METKLEEFFGLFAPLEARVGSSRSWIRGSQARRKSKKRRAEDEENERDATRTTAPKRARDGREGRREAENLDVETKLGGHLHHVGLCAKKRSTKAKVSRKRGRWDGEADLPTWSLSSQYLSMSSFASLWLSAT
jgi:hypothetical protein